MLQMPSTEPLLHKLVAEAGLPEITSYEDLQGNGFDHLIVHATLADSQEVVLRSRKKSWPLPVGRARFLTEHDLPAPALLGGNEFATLYEYVPGEMLYNRVAEDRMTDDSWRSVGTAFRRVHAVRFPSGLSGPFDAGRLVLEAIDPVQDLHERIAAAVPRLEVSLPFVLPHLPRLHAIIDAYADSLRPAPTALLHGDVFPTNIIVGPDRTTLIDWDFPRVADPAQEVSALDEWMYLAGGGCLADAFFDAYGPRPPNTGLYRVTGAIGWFGRGPFNGWEIDFTLDEARTEQVTGWRNSLVAYLTDLGDRLDEL